ncbi:hypothetical protein [Streptomyces sp. NPDC018833]|uniref:hypothetical protein n=1 Tax=Streptomyces sp. NPDC018833 TaxID=3365053 RepID=UPI0037BAF550
MRTRTTAAALLLAAALVGCSNSSDDKPAAADSPSPEPATSSSEPAPEPTPTRQPILKMGTEWGFTGSDGIEGAVTVIDYRQGFKSVGDAAEEGAAGYQWAYVELKTCSISGTFPATTEPWTLSYEDGSRVEPSSTTYGDFPKPEFPFETTLTDGKCVRGKLVFSVPGDSWPHTVVYAPAGLDVPQEWAVPTKG